MANLLNIRQEYMNTKGNRQLELDSYHKGVRSVIPVYSRASVSPLKASTHTNIHVDFFKDIIDRKVGYGGQNISIDYRGESEQLRQVFVDNCKLNSLSVKNSESFSDTSVSGLSHRLCYTEDGIFKYINLKGWDVVYDYKHDIFDPDAAYYFYTITDLEGNVVNRCDLYTRTDVYYYKENKKGIVGPSTRQLDSYQIDSTIQNNPQPHNFNQVPIFPIMNNKLMKGDCDETTQIMDVYDEIVSDTAGELKAARLAYLKIFGDLYTGVDEQGNEISIPDYLREFGVLLFGKDIDGKPSGDAEFLEKKLDDVAIENMLKRLRALIYELSGSIDLRELTDSQSARIFTIKAALLRLENSVKTTETYFKQALYKQIKLWCEYVRSFYSLSCDASEFDINFERNFVKDKSSLAEVLAKLVTVMPLEDAYRISELLDDPAAVAQRYREEQGLLFEGEE